jgi:hypothetical protein
MSFSPGWNKMFEELLAMVNQTIYQEYEGSLPMQVTREETVPKAI